MKPVAEKITDVAVKSNADTTVDNPGTAEKELVARKNTDAAEQNLTDPVKENFELILKDLGTNTEDMSGVVVTEGVVFQNNVDLQMAAGSVIGKPSKYVGVFINNNKFDVLNAIAEEREIVEVGMSPGNSVIKEDKCCDDILNLAIGLNGELNINEGCSSNIKKKGVKQLKGLDQSNWLL
ncbi:hypothetical protein MA16_Dca011880 [Dendrobium catenatum]|uniref:Uncharacterized protein n=1 Tax=Dendrobium catenatum TaxID=906689 RepID=A0A2I0W2I2_9ASPA|nr:hypothetical protein MA16_Dca011880 [Dendrobium catenatum]